MDKSFIINTTIFR